MFNVAVLLFHKPEQSLNRINDHKTGRYENLIELRNDFSGGVRKYTYMEIGTYNNPPGQGPPTTVYLKGWCHYING